MEKTVCSAYSGLVPMSPKTTPSAASASPPPACAAREWPPDDGAEATVSGPATDATTRSSAWSPRWIPDVPLVTACPLDPASCDIRSTSSVDPQGDDGAL